VCDRFELGTITARPLAIDGGLSNRLYRVVTDRGEFAVKRMVANADAPSFKSNVEASFAVERQAHSAGIAMPDPVPVPGTSEALARVDQDGTPGWVRVHTWVPARRVTAEETGSTDLARVGSILASLHRLPLAGQWQSASPHEPGSPRAWRTAGSSTPLDSVLIDTIGVLEGIVRRGHAANRSRLVLSHRDLDAKNLLRDAHGRLIAIDWDAAGPTDAHWDVVGVAMDWSGVREGTPSRKAFAELLDGYVQAGGHLDPVSAESFAGWSQGVLDWLWFNLERTASPEPSERLLGESEVACTSRFLPRAASLILALV